MTADELLTKKNLADFKKEMQEMLSPLLGGKLPSQQKWLKNKDVRALLGVSSNTIVSLRESGKLPYHKVNSTYIYKQSDIDEMMKGLEKKSPKTKKG
jgi:hypothetical protein